MSLDKSAKTRYREIHVGISECLPKLIRIPREKIRERAKEVCAAEAVRHASPQPNAIHSSTCLPQVFTPCACVSVVGLIVIFTALAIPGGGMPKDDESRNVNFRAGRLVRAEDGAAGGSLEAKITNGLRPQDSRERS